jgi:septum formation protein
MTKPRLTLASGSRIRADILRGAGLDFEIVRPDVDENAIKQDAAKEGLGLEEIAMRLAEKKAMAVAGSHDGIVIGADQILEFGGRAYDKPASMEEAKARLMEMQGKAHTLINAVAAARNGRLIWRSLDRPKLVMRALSGAEIDTYLQEAGPDVLASVGAYQIEKTGSRLFERIEGDHFAVLGLGLFPLLALLRREGAIQY